MLIGPASSLPVVTTGSANKILAANAGGSAYEFIRRFGNRTVVVAPAEGDYTTLSGALAAITTASSSDQWLIVIAGAISESASIAAKSNISVLFLPGASVTVTTTSSGNGVNFSSITNSSWVGFGSAPHFTRTGTLASGTAHALNVNGGDNTLRFEGLVVRNEIGHSGTPSDCYGAMVQGTPAAIFTRCDFRGAPVGSVAIGVRVIDGNCIFTDCFFRGGLSSGNASHGVYITNTSSNKFHRCHFDGGSGATGGSGVQLIAIGTTEFHDCEILGGTGSSGQQYGFQASGFAVNALLKNCYVRGGDNAAANYGIYVNAGGNVIVCGGTSTGGWGGTSCHGFLSSSQGMATISQATLLGGGVSRPVTDLYSYAAATPSFVMDAAKPMRLLTARIAINSATSGGTLTLADDALNTNPLAPSISLASVTNVIVVVTSAQVIAAGGSIFVNVTGSPADSSFSIRWVGEVSFGGATTTACTGALPDSDNYVKFSQCDILSNSDSDAVYIRTNGQLRTSFQNCNIRSGPRNVGTRKKAINSTGTWNPAAVYQCTLDGGTANVTAAAGTANGTNVEY